MTREIQPGDRVEWQGLTQMMSGFVQSVENGRNYTVRVFNGAVDEEHAEDHVVHRDQFLVVEPGSV